MLTAWVSAIGAPTLGVLLWAVTGLLLLGMIALGLWGIWAAYLAPLGAGLKKMLDRIH